MHKLSKIIIVLIFPLVLLGCGTMYFDAPEGRRVKILERDDSTNVRAERKVWYALWGNKVLGDNHSATLISTNNLDSVRLYSYQSGSDAFLNVFTMIVSFYRRTLTVEGNAAGEVKP